MTIRDWFRSWRDWFPVPLKHRGISPVRWILLEGNRLAVTGALLTFVFGSLLAIGMLWTFEMQRLLTETSAVQTILNTFLGGIILLVSIVVSINSTVLSYDLSSIRTQDERMVALFEYRRQIGQLADGGESPTDPAAFLEVMADVLRRRAQALSDVTEGADEEFAKDVEAYASDISATADRIKESSAGVSGADFGVLWEGQEINYGQHLNSSRVLRTSYGNRFSEDFSERLDDLVEAFRLFATGKEYFKTLYYTQETSQLSRTLLIIALPAIIVNASTILAISAGLLPEFSVLGLPPLQSFVAAAVTVSLAPFVVLTSYTLRLATVARRTAGAGPYTLKS